MKYTLISVLLLLVTTSYAGASVPTLNFSDLISGPSTGNTDGAGSGTIVTVWGNNLGDSQGGSTVHIGNVAVDHIYYWKRADGGLPGGPADLYSYHQMQEICFSIPAGAPVGLSDITVTVSSIESNGIGFTVRPGSIFFVAPYGNDAIGDGSWGAPWGTLQYVFGNSSGGISPGDVVYDVGLGSNSGISVGSDGRIVGTAGSPVSLSAYPGHQSNIQGGSQNGYIIYNYNEYDDDLASTYLNFSKLKILCDVVNPTGIRAFIGNRVVGVEITGPTVYEGSQGAIGGNRQAAGGGKYFGVHIHHYGRDNGVPYAGNTSTQPPYTSDLDRTSWDAFQHLYYLSNRFSAINLPYEIGWNNLSDNPIWQGIHIFDQGSVGGWSGTISIHDNLIKNQRGGSIEVDLPDMTSNPTVLVYNNLILSTPGDTYNDRALQLTAPNSDIIVLNNTVWGYRRSSVLNTLSTLYSNNIMYDYRGIDFIATEPSSHTNNLFFSSTGSPQPSWAPAESGNVTGDPLFVDAAGGDFSLQENSPALSSGAPSIYTSDFIGAPRPQGAGWDLGAIESAFGGQPPAQPGKGMRFGLGRSLFNPNSRSIFQ